MKTYFTLFFITLCMSTFYAQTPSVSDDEEAIKKVIIAETAASSTTNLEAWADCFVHEPYTFTVHKTKVLWTSENYEKMYEAQKKNFNKPETKANMQMFSNPTRSNWNIQIRGNVAWARFIETVKQADGSDLSLHDLRVLEKQQDNKCRQRQEHRAPDDRT